MTPHHPTPQAEMLHEAAPHAALFETAEAAGLHSEVANIVSALASVPEDNRALIESDVTTILGSAEHRGAILHAVSSGLTYGWQVMDKIGGSTADYAKKLMAEAADSDVTPSIIASDMVDGANDFSRELHAVFNQSFLRALPVFAALLTQPDGEQRVTMPIFENSDRFKREIGYVGGDALTRAQYALDLSTEALRRIAISQPAAVREVVHPGGTHSTPSHTYVLENDEGLPDVRMYVREWHEKNWVTGEYGNREGVQPSVSFKVNLSDRDRRSAHRPRPEEQLGKAYGRREDDHKSPLPESITISRRERKAALEYLSRDFAQEGMSEISFRIDFEGNYPEHRGLSLDLGSILSDANGLSYVVGNLFATGDVLLSQRLGKSDTFLNHNTSFDQKAVGNENTFAFIARAVADAMSKEELRDVQLAEQYTDLGSLALHRRRTSGAGSSTR